MSAGPLRGRSRGPASFSPLPFVPRSRFFPDSQAGACRARRSPPAWSLKTRPVFLAPTLLIARRAAAVFFAMLFPRCVPRCFRATRLFAPHSSPFHSSKGQSQLTPPGLLLISRPFQPTFPWRVLHPCPLRTRRVSPRLTFALQSHLFRPMMALLLNSCIGGHPSSFSSPALSGPSSPFLTPFAPGPRGIFAPFPASTILFSLMP